MDIEEMSTKAVITTATDISMTRRRLSLCAKLMAGALWRIGARPAAANVRSVRIRPMI